MHLPPELISGIESLSEGVSLKALAAQSEKLTAQYRAGHFALKGREQHLAYLHTRLPATYAAVTQVLQELMRRAPEADVTSVADVGAGPGTGFWAAYRFFPQVKEVDFYEQDPIFIELCQQLAEQVSVNKNWIKGDLRQVREFASKDLCIASYVLGELEDEGLVFKLWEATQKFLILIEPGTPQGFERIRRVREMLIGQGAHLIAPCPHIGKCPMEKGDWCHFYARVERSAFHRRMKSGSLNFEDEKFSYLIFSRGMGTRADARVVRNVDVQPARVTVQLCTKSGIENFTAIKKNKEQYKKCRKIKWGDEFNF